MAPPRNSAKRGASSQPTDGKQQQQISTMLGERVSKPRTFTEGMPPMLKRRKLDSAGIGSEVPVAKHPTPPPAKTAVMAQKRKWRLSEILERDREARKSRKEGAPAFVLLAPHMDTRRPGTQPENQPNPEPTKGKKKTNLKQVRFWSEGKDAVAVDAPLPISSCIYNKSTNTRKRDVHCGTAVSGGEAILYSRLLLPTSHVLLLDVLIGLESAVALLKTRRTIPTMGAVRDIVRRSTRREFTVKILSQLAHLVPEAVAVLPGPSSQKNRKKASDSLLVRLDDVDVGEDGVEKDDIENGSNSSVLGDTAARIRRSLLHKRLLEHVKEEHARFLRKRSISRHEGELWHEDFDLETDVEDLPAPPLYPLELKNRAQISEKVSAPSMQGSSIQLPPPNVETSKHDLREGAQESDNVESVEECIPSSLLEKVRARSQARKAVEANLEVEKFTNRSLLSKLPVTMDTICSILRGERRSAMGWSQLLVKVEKLHPKKWPREDLSKQFDAITALGAEWCKKIELKSSRGGFAFRVHSEVSFGNARATVCSTTSYTPLAD